MTDQSFDDAPVAPSPAAAPSLMKGLVLACLVLTILSLVSHGYLWYLWRQDQAIKPVPVAPQPDPEWPALKTQVYQLSGDLEAIKKAVELYKAENEALQVEMKQWQDRQNAYRNEVEQQLQDYRDQSIQQQQTQDQHQKRNKVTW